MNRRILTVAFLVIITALSRAAHAVEDKTYPLGKAGTLHIAVPEGWTGENDGTFMPTTTLKSPAAKHVSIQITAVPGDPSDAKVKAAARAVGVQYASSSVEKKFTLEEVKGAAVHGYMSSFTDASKEPVEYRMVTAGIVASGKQQIAITVLCDDKASPDHAAAMAAIKSISVTPLTDAEKAKPTGPAEWKVASPDGSWTLTIAGKWVGSPEDKSPDRKSNQYSAISEDGAELTIFFEPAAQPKGDAKAAREFYLTRMKRNPLGMDHLKKDLVGEIATLEYDQGIGGFKPHNMNAYYAHAGIWVDVHYSKPTFNEKNDLAALIALVRGLKAEPAKPAGAPVK